MELELGDEHRACGECGADCSIDVAASEGHGVRFVMTCKKHGIQAVIDPFGKKR